MKYEVSLTVNGEKIIREVEPQSTLLDLLRNELKFKGAKKACGQGDCGACTVLMDGQPVNACLVLAVTAKGKEITTIEGIGTPEKPHPLQKAWHEKLAAQCGYCASGMILSAKALLDKNPNPTVEDIKKAISGNLCRCTGYYKPIEAVLSAKEELQRES